MNIKSTSFIFLKRVTEINYYVCTVTFHTVVRLFKMRKKLTQYYCLKKNCLKFLDSFPLCYHAKFISALEDGQAKVIE